MTKKISIAAILIVSLLSGCAGIFKKTPLSADQTSVAEIRHRVEQNYLKFHSMKAKARFSVESPQMNFVANSTINMKKPDAIKISLSVGFGFGVGSVFLNSKKFQLYNSFENTLYSGCPDSINLKNFIPVDIKLEDLLQVFSGIQLLKSYEKEMLSVDKNQYQVISENDNGTMKFWIDPKKFVVTKYQLIDSNKNVLIEIEYKSFLKKNNVRLPKTVRIFQPERKTRLTLVFSNSDVNVRMKDKDFQIKLPNNVKKIELSKNILNRRGTKTQL